MDRAPWVLAFALVGLACRHQDDGDDDFGEDDLAGVETPASEHPPMASCPADAPTLGIADGTAVDRVALNWDSNGAESYVDDYLYFMVPDDILSLMIAVEHDAELTSVNSMVLDNQVYIDMLGAFGEAPFWHWPVAVASVAMPISENTLPRGGCLVLDPVAYADLAGESGTLHIVSRRGPSVPTLIDVNVYLVGDTQIPQADIDAALAHMDELYQNGGSAALGQVTFETIDWPDPFVDSEGPEA
ncbi:MAG: hypothetical protein KC431_29070, partial [Myxococcales bacterium]|nr:hypothetical protein [Myxococcales bacterium]